MDEKREIDEIVLMGDYLRSHIYKSISHSTHDREDIKILTKLDHHERQLRTIPIPTSNWRQRVRFGWHTGWIRTHYIIYSIKLDDRNRP